MLRHCFDSRSPVLFTNHGRKLSGFTGLVLFAFLMAPHCMGQARFRGLIAGSSTRSQVQKVLGQPVQKVSATLSQYASATAGENIYVQYNSGSDRVERIEIVLPAATPRADEVHSLQLPEQSKSKEIDNKGRLLEYFGSPYDVVLTYAAGDQDSGVTRVGYYSPSLFGATVNQPPAGTPGAGNTANPAPTGTGGEPSGIVPQQPPPESQPQPQAQPQPQPPPRVTGRIPQNSSLVIRLNEALDTEKTKVGESFTGVIEQQLTARGIVVVPKGAPVTGQVIQAQNSGQVSGSASLTLRLTSLTLGGKSYPVETSSFSQTASQGKTTAKHALLGALAGAAIGAAAGGGQGAAIGSVAGAGVGSPSPPQSGSSCPRRRFSLSA